MTDLELKKKKLRLNACRRGLLEAELLLCAFARQELDQMTLAQLEDFERLLEMEDLDFWEMICGRRPIPPGLSKELVDRLRHYLPSKPNRA
jgi:antitoxin CptB